MPELAIKLTFYSALLQRSEVAAAVFFLHFLVWSLVGTISGRSGASVDLNQKNAKKICGCGGPLFERSVAQCTNFLEPDLAIQFFFPILSSTNFWLH